MGRLTNVVDALNQVTSYAYDEAGNLVSQTDANGHTTTFEYDSMGRRVKRTLPEGQVETYAYDPVGSMTNKVDFKGKVTTFEYDSMNRLTAKLPDASFSASNIVFAYNASGQRLSMSDQTGVTTYEYDSRDRLIEKVTPIGTLDYGYDAQGNLTNILGGQVSSFEFQVSYSYDILNRLKTVNDYRSGLTLYNYDNVGNLQDYIYPNGVVHAYEYDGLNRLTNMSMNRLTDTLVQYSYALNPSGHRLSEQRITDNGQRSVSYTYDNLYRLTSETVSGSIIAGQIAYTYDAVGNRLTRNSTVTNILAKLYSYDMNDRLGSDSYDDAGNTVAASLRDAPSGTETPFTYSYDFENRVLSAQSASSAVAILYDGDGNRVGKTVNGTTIRYLVDDRNPSGYSQVLAELTPNTDHLAPFRVYTYGLDLISQDQIRGTNWVLSFYGYDGHGNVRFLTDDQGYITDTYDYDAFGTLIEQKVWDPSFMALVLVSPDNRELITDNHYLYCGEQFDPDLGLYFLRARYMDTDRGRFWTMDPWQGVPTEPLSLHRYLYAGANPVFFADPSGQRSLVELVGVTGIISILANVAVTAVFADIVTSGLSELTGYFVKGGFNLPIPNPSVQGDLGFGVFVSIKTGQKWFFASVSGGIQAKGIGGFKPFFAGVGVVWNVSDGPELEQVGGLTATWPAPVIPLLSRLSFVKKSALGPFIAGASALSSKLGGFSLKLSIGGLTADSPALAELSTGTSLGTTLFELTVTTPLPGGPLALLDQVAASLGQNPSMGDLANAVTAIK